MYYWLREDWTLKSTMVGTPDIGNDEIDFLLGTPITTRFNTPVRCDVTHKSDESMQHYFDYGTCIPIVSKKFVDTLVYAGVDNFETFPAELISTSESARWTNYFALNVWGMVDAIDLDNSKYHEIMGGNDDGMPPLATFVYIALFEDRIRGLEFFREPVGNNLIISERVLNKLLECYPKGGIGIIAHEVLLT